MKYYLAFLYSSPDRRIAVSKLVDQIVIGEPDDIGIDADEYPERLMGLDVRVEYCRNSRNALQRLDNRLRLGFGVIEAFFMVQGHPPPDGCDDSHDFLPIDLVWSSDAPDSPCLVTDERVAADGIDYLFRTQGEPG